MSQSLGAGSVVIVHLTDPSEKLWGVIERLDALGLVLRGLNVSTFDDWTSEAASREDPSLGLATMFLPMRRLERVFLDEQIGAVESYCQRFERRVGVSIWSYLGMPQDDGLPPS